MSPSISLLSIAFSALVLTGRPARAEPPTHEIQRTSTQARPGVPARAALTVQAKNGWHLNENAPITVSAKADPGVELPRPKLVRADLVQSTKETARFEIPFTVAAAGTKTITAEARFVMCQEEACKPVKETVALNIDVAEPAAAGPTGAGVPAKPGQARRGPGGSDRVPGPKVQ